MKINSTDKALLRAVERGEWRPIGISQRERSRYERHAKATLRKYRRLTINLSTRDFEALRGRALAAGVPCDTLVATVLHKCATGRLRDDLESGSETDLEMTAPKRTAAAAREPGELIVPRLLNMRQAAKYLGCSFWTIRDYVLQGRIPVVQLPPVRARTGARQRCVCQRILAPL